MRSLKILAWVHVVTGLFAIFAAIVFVGMGVTDPEPDSLLIGTLLGGFMAAKAVFSVVLGWGLLTLKPWSRMLGIILSVLHLPLMPVGTAIGIFGLIVLVEPEVRALLSGQLPPRATWG